MSTLCWAIQACRWTKRVFTIILLRDSIEFLYTSNKKKIIDKELWQRWENHAKSMMTIPKFKKVWNATKEFHTQDFVSFMDSL
jgi:hypothetical protein